jgi:hypothetical protein
MSARPLILVIIILGSACGNVRLQSPEEIGRGLTDGAQRQQSKRLCAQQNDPALRFQCEQQAQKEFQKYQIEQRKKNNE